MSILSYSKRIILNAVIRFRYDNQHDPETAADPARDRAPGAQPLECRGGTAYFPARREPPGSAARAGTGRRVAVAAAQPHHGTYRARPRDPRRGGTRAGRGGQHTVDRRRVQP